MRYRATVARTPKTAIETSRSLTPAKTRAPPSSRTIWEPPNPARFVETSR